MNRIVAALMVFALAGCKTVYTPTTPANTQTDFERTKWECMRHDNAATQLGTLDPQFEPCMVLHGWKTK